MSNKIVFFWFRRDLRLHDNHGLYMALKSGFRVVPVFIFDSVILSKLENKSDKRVVFIHRQIAELKSELKKSGSDLIVKHGTPEEAWTQVFTEFPASAIYTNRDYEPYALNRDNGIEEIAKKYGVDFIDFKDQVIFETNEVVKDDGNPYTVFTPYSKKWKSLFSENLTAPFDLEKHQINFHRFNSEAMPELEQLGFKDGTFEFPSKNLDVLKLKKYESTRDFPAVDGTSKMSLHLRFGTVSIRELFSIGIKHSEKWVNELIWREFYMQILWHYPHVVNHSFKPEYDRIEWLNSEVEFEAWCNGKTRYPIVDAGMRELNETGFMHNRVRMIVASFLTKHLLIDWRWGEAYFAEKLLDYELSSNNGGWQWAAGCGVDAAPYFRIFNPHLQTQKFDSNYIYIRKWVPEFDSPHYVKPMVEHEFARKRCLETYKRALSK